MTGSYTPQLVVLSFVIATLASYAALDLAGRVTAASGPARTAWLAGGALVMGLGIWSMHFVGMLAFHLPVPIAYSLPLMLLSAGVAVGAALLALVVVSRSSLTPKALVAAGTIMGFAIAGMHYIGMASMYMKAVQTYRVEIVVLSVLIAIAASTAALWLAFTFRTNNGRRWHLLRAASSLVMGGAIAGMHYTAMAGARFAASSKAGTAHGHILASDQLGAIVALGAFLIIALAITGGFVDRTLQARAAINARLQKQAEELESKYAEASTLAAELEKTNRDLQEALKAAETSNLEAQRSAEALRASEERLRHSQRLEAIGNLAGGIAHDFNNLLTAMRLNAELLRTDNEPDRSVDLEELLRSIDRAATLTRQLLAYGRRQMLNPTNLTLNTVIGRMETMIRRLIAENIEIRFDLEPALAVTHVDEGQMEQVLTNLVINASLAMPAGGTLVIRTRNMRSSEAQLGAVSGPPDTVMMAVEDNGYGMTSEIRQRAFEPFFTTRQKGEGSGLGLSTVYGIVKQSGGDVDIESVWGQGTVVRVFLPRVEAEAPEVVEAAPEILPPGKERILLVEDQDEVRAATRRILVAQGYSVIEAENGDEGLVKYMQMPEAFDLVLTDLVMPHMGGRELVAALRRHHTRSAIVYMTGYSTESVSIDEATIPIIRKPFSASEFLSVVRHALDDRSAARAAHSYSFRSPQRHIRLA